MIVEGPDYWAGADEPNGDGRMQFITSTPRAMRGLGTTWTMLPTPGETPGFELHSEVVTPLGPHPHRSAPMGMAMCAVVGRTGGFRQSAGEERRSPASGWSQHRTCRCCQTGYGEAITYRRGTSRAHRGPSGKNGRTRTMEQSRRGAGAAWSGSDGARVRVTTGSAAYEAPRGGSRDTQSWSQAGELTRSGAGAVGAGYRGSGRGRGPFIGPARAPARIIQRGPGSCRGAGSAGAWARSRRESAEARAGDHSGTGRGCCCSAV